MVTLTDGPCKGIFMVRRSPALLRATLKAELDGTGATDVLDQPDDTPAPQEKVYVYQMLGEPTGFMHIHSSVKGASGFFASAEYKYLADVDGEQLRDNAAWRRWCFDNVERLTGHAYCRKCGKQLIPAPARFDGEPAIVGYLPCDHRTS